MSYFTAVTARSKLTGTDIRRKGNLLTFGRRSQTLMISEYGSKMRRQCQFGHSWFQTIHFFFGVCEHHRLLLVGLWCLFSFQAQLSCCPISPEPPRPEKWQPRDWRRPAPQWAFGPLRVTAGHVFHFLTVVDRWTGRDIASAHFGQSWFYGSRKTRRILIGKIALILKIHI